MWSVDLYPLPFPHHLQHRSGCRDNLVSLNNDIDFLTHPLACMLKLLLYVIVIMILSYQVMFPKNDNYSKITTVQYNMGAEDVGHDFRRMHI